MNILFLSGGVSARSPYGDKHEGHFSLRAFLFFIGKRGWSRGGKGVTAGLALLKLPSPLPRHTRKMSAHLAPMWASIEHHDSSRQRGACADFPTIWYAMPPGFADVYVHTYIYIYIYMIYISLSLCIYIYIYIYIHNVYIHRCLREDASRRLPAGQKLRPISLLRLSLLRFLGSNLLGNSL